MDRGGDCRGSIRWSQPWNRTRSRNTAIHRQDRAGDPRRRLGRKEQNSSGNVIRLPDALQWMKRRGVLLDSVPQQSGEPGAHDRRGHGIHSHPRRQFEGELPREMDQRRLRDVVCAEGGAGLESPDRRDVDDRAAGRRSSTDATPRVTKRAERAGSPPRSCPPPPGRRPPAAQRTDWCPRC